MTESWAPPTDPPTDPRSRQPTRSAPRRVIGELGRRVVADPVRDGRLRSDGWPAGVRPVITLGLVVYGLAALVTLTGGWLRRSLPPGDSAFGIAPELYGPGIVLVIVLASLITTASLHLRGWPGAVGLIPAPTAWACLTTFSLQPYEVLWLPLGTAALVGLWLWRRRREFAWWEFPAVAAVIGGITAILLIRTVRPALGNDYYDIGLELTALILSVGIVAIPLTVQAGAAVSELAVSTAGWVVELVSREIPRRARPVLLVAALLLAWLVVGLRWQDSVLTLWPHVITVGVAGVLVTGSALVFVLLDGRRGTPTTRLPELIPPFRTVALVLSVAVTAPFVVSWVWARFESGLRPALRPLGWDYVPSSLLQRIGLGTVDPIAAGYPVAVVAGLVLVVLAVRSGRGAQAQVAGLATLLCAARMLSEFGVPYAWLSLDDLSAVALLVATAAAVGCAVRGRLTGVRAEAIGIGILIALAVASRDLIADPFAWLLQNAGPAVVILGLAWTLLTGAADANGDSVRAPRPARAMAVVACLSVAAVIAALDAVAVTFAVDLDRFVLIGSEVFGTALLLAAIWTVVSAAARDERVVEPAG